MKGEKLTLQQRVECIAPGVVMHICSGSGFHFIGTKEEYERDIDKVSKELLHNMKKMLRKRKAAKEEYTRCMKKLMLMPVASEDDDAVKTVEEYASRIAVLAKDIPKYNRQILTLEGNIKAFKPLRNRNAQEPYFRTLRDGIVIIVDGNEAGKYWFYDEYKHGISEQEE